MFKIVQSDKRMSLKEDSLEKLVVHCFIKIKHVNNVELNFNTAYLYYFSVSLSMFSHIIVHECMHVSRFDSAWKSGLYLSSLPNVRMFGNRRAPSASPSLLMFRIDHAIARVSLSLVLYRDSRSGSFTLARRS